MFHSLKFSLCVFLAAACAGVCHAQPQQIEPSGTATAQPAQSAPASSGVVYPHRAERFKQQKIKDELPPAQRTQAEVDRSTQLHFVVDPRRHIDKFLNDLKFPKGMPVLQRANVIYLDNAALNELFPNAMFYCLRFPQWPIAISVPEPLGNNNVFVVSKETNKDIHLITNKEQLKQFLSRKMPATQTELRAKQAIDAVLTLAVELEQDGMFKFEPHVTGFKADKGNGLLKATGQINVVPAGGNSGTISATITFDGKGDLSNFDYEAKLQRGMRPICQSTKLLDPDPIVRKMAEQDLLIMGSSAKSYLEWQRTQVSPDLQKAIDKIWSKIVEEGR